MKKTIIMLTIVLGMISTTYGQELESFTRYYTTVEHYDSDGELGWNSNGISNESTTISYNLGGTKMAVIIFDGGSSMVLYSVAKTERYENGSQQFSWTDNHDNTHYGWISNEHATIIIGDRSWTFK